MQARAVLDGASCACPVLHVVHRRPRVASKAGRSSRCRRACDRTICQALSWSAACPRSHTAAPRSSWTVPVSALTSDSASTSISSNGTIHTTWNSPDGTLFEVLWQPAGGSSSSSSSSSGGSGSSQAPGQPSTEVPPPHEGRRPPVVLIHGLFRAAWCWEEHLLPALAAAGHDTYALSLRGQGGSDIGGAAEISERAGGVPLGVNVGDIADFVATLGEPPVLVGHSLGGMFVQEYLALLAAQAQGEQAQQAAAPSTTSNPNPRSSSSSRRGPSYTFSAPLPPLAGAVLLASATAGTVMAFDRFVSDVGLGEFLYQMYIVAAGAHLADIATARYCWWGEGLSEQDAQRYFRVIRASSRVTPYIAREVGAWAPPPAPRGVLPPVLALGGGADRIIRPWQVAAAEGQWGAAVVVLPGVTHDMMLGQQGQLVAGHLTAWLEDLVEGRAAAAAPAAVDSTTSSGRPGWGGGVEPYPVPGSSSRSRVGRAAEDLGELQPPLVMGSLDST